MHGINEHSERTENKYTLSSRRSMIAVAKAKLASILAKEYPELGLAPKLLEQVYQMLSFSIRKPSYYTGDPKEDASNTCLQPITVTRKKLY